MNDQPFPDRFDGRQPQNDQGVPPQGDGARGLARSIDLRDLWAPIYRSRWAVLAIFGFALALAIAATLFIEPLFRAAATVEIKSETQQVLGTEDKGESVAGGADTNLFLDTQLDIIRSRATTVAVAQSLGLYNDDNFLVRMGYDIPAEQSGALPAVEERRKLVNNILLDNLSVEFTNQTRIAQIRFSSPDAPLAAQVANSYAENYIQLNLARRFDASSYSLDFLREQIGEAQARLAESEREAIGYARNSRLIDASTAAGSSADSGAGSLTVASLVDLNQQLSAANARRIQAEQRWNVAQATPLLMVPEVAQNSSVQQLQQQKALAQSELQQQLERRTEEYPAVRELRARIASLDTQINAIASNVRATIRSEFQTARSQEAGLSNRLNQLKDTTLDEQSRSIQLSILRREADTNREQLDALLTRYNELNAEAGVQLNNLSIIDAAEVPQVPYWPSLPLNLALGIVLGIIGSTVFILGRENLFELVRTPEDIASRLRQPVLGAVPNSENVLDMLRDPKTPVSEAISTIRTNLTLSSGNGIPTSFMVTSTQAGEGKSTIAYGLAQGIAKLGRSVILVDADIRRPNVHRLFETDNDIGTSAVLSGSAELDDVIRKGALPNLDVITGGVIPPDPAELLASGRLEQIVATLREKYDHVIVDSAPVLGLADAPLVATNMAGVVFVVEAARTSVRSVQNAIERMSRSGKPILGVVLSRFDPGQSGYSYEYRYAYEYKYAEGAR